MLVVILECGKTSSPGARESAAGFHVLHSGSVQTYGPFDESVVIGEKWPLTAACYRQDRERFIYDESLYATTSNRRMEKQRFGYTLTFLKYVWAVLHRSGRLRYSDWIR